MRFALLILSLPTENGTVRMRAWRALKACGAAVLRDGVYLLPEQASCRATLDAIADDVRVGGGTAHVLSVDDAEGDHYRALFDRSAEYAELIAEIRATRSALSGDNVLDVLKQTRKLRKSFAALAEVDFFAGEARGQADAALQDLELAANRVLSPDEPHAISTLIPTRRIADFKRRTWATRRRPWVDRLACAWLIRRFIDSKARILWLKSPAQCPRDALGFDFDGATFSHVGARVTFEVMLASFGLERPALIRIGALVHYLDAGGVQPPEACGVESVLAGLRETLTDDDQLLKAACAVFDGLLAGIEQAAAPA
jgi:hypothetical protein